MCEKRSNSEETPTLGRKGGRGGEEPSFRVLEERVSLSKEKKTVKKERLSSKNMHCRGQTLAMSEFA